MPPHILFGLGGPALDAFFGNFVYNGLVASGGAACLWRAARGGRERLAWLFLGIGMLSWLGGDLYWTIFLADLDSPPFPSPGDALYLGFYHCCYVALGLLARARLQNIPRSAWLDGAIWVSPWRRWPARWCSSRSSTPARATPRRWPRTSPIRSET